MSGIKRHILVVDDNEYNREILVQSLEDFGYDCEEAEDGEEALRKIAAAVPMLVLLDWMMPQLDGFGVCERLRADPATKDLPIIMVTAKADSRDIVAGLRAGANDYVTKPIDFDVLLARVETHLRLRELQLETRRLTEGLIEDMEAARAAQEELLPAPEKLDALQASYGLRIAALWQPGAIVSGDFWDLLALADGSLGIALADFAGSGVVPALHTFRLKSFLEAQCSDIYNASLTMARVNGALSGILSDWEIAMFLYARYNPDRSNFTIAAGGTPPPIVYRAHNQAVERPAARGMPVGAFAETSWKEIAVPMEKGDKIVFFTDGLLKARHRERQKDYYNDGRLAELLVRLGPAPPKDIVAALRRELESYIDHPATQDDLTVIVAEVVD